MKKILILLLSIINISLSIESVGYDDSGDDDVATLDEPILSLKNSGPSFSKSKYLLAKEIYKKHPIAFYSGCKYKIKNKKLIPMPRACGFHYRKNKVRARRIEWEHIVPAWHFGHQLKCWQNGGRKNCQQNDKKFRAMEADMHNLVPAIGEINGDRSNFRYSMIEGENRIYGKKIDMEIDFQNRKAEPPTNRYGDIARTYFYMRDKYRLKLSPSQEKLFIAWNNMDPVDDWEKEKNEMVKKIQGDDNSYISNYRKMDSSNIKSSNSSFNDIQNELKEKYSYIFDNLSKPIGSTILFILTIFILYKRKKR